MAEKTIVVDIEIQAEDIKKANESMASSAKSAQLLTLELNKLKEEQKKNNAEAKAGTISATELAARQAGLKLKMTETSKALAASNKEYANNKVVVDAAKGSNDQLKARLSLLTAEQNKLTKSQRESTKEGKQLEATISTISEKLKANEKAVGDNRRNVGNYSDAMKGAVGTLKNFAGALGITAGIAGLTKVLKEGIKIAKDFEQGNANLASILGTTSSEITNLTNDAKRLGAATSFSATQVSTLQTEFAKLGFNEQEILNATEATLNLAAATGSELGEAAAIAGATLGGFGLDAAETARVTDVMAKSFSTSALDLEKFKESMKDAAPAAKAVGVDVEKTTALLGSLANAGISGSKAGTALKAGFIELNAAGINLDDALVKIANSNDKLATATDLVGKRAATSFLVLADGVETTNELEVGLRNAGGAAKKMADEQLNTLEGKTKILNSAWEGLVLSLLSGSGVFSDISKGLVEMATGLLSALTPAEELESTWYAQRDAVDNLESSLSPLLDRYDELSGQTELTVSEQEELDTIILKVAEDVPSAITAFDEYGKALDISTSAAKSFIQQQKDLLALDNAKAIKEQEDAINGLNTQLNKLNNTYEMQNGVLFMYSRELEKATGGRESYIKAGDEEIRQYQKSAAEIQKNIALREAKIRKLKGEQTELELLAEKERLAQEAAKKAAEEAEKAANGKGKLSEKAAKEAEKAAKEAEKAAKKAAADLIKGWEDQRKLIDQQAEVEKNNAIISIENAEERAEKIAFIEREALLQKIANIDEETIAATAGDDIIGAADQEKYAKQLAERAKYEAQIAMMDRAEKAEAFTDQIEYLSKQEQLEIQNAEFSIKNAKDLEKKKAEISLRFLETKLALMRESALADDVLTEQEIQNLQLVENQIKRLKGLLDGSGEDGGVPTFAEAVGMTEEDFAKFQVGLQVAAQAVSALQAVFSQSSQNRIQTIDETAQAQITAIEQSTQSEEEKAANIKAIERRAAEEKYKIELEQFKVSKGLQITNAIIQGVQAAIAAYSSAAAIPIAGVALAPVMAGIAAAFAAVQIGVIAAQKPPPPPQFASGGYVSGPGTGTSDSIDAKLSNGEAVINAKSTAKYGPLLSAINADGGGVDWYRGKGVSGGFFGNAFAGGGIASPTFAARQATNSNTQGLEARIEQLGNRIEQMQPIVRVTDINRINQQTVRVQQSADL